MAIFKIDLEAHLKTDKTIILELGCGKNKHDGCIGIDILDLPNVDILADLELGLPFLPDNCIDEVHSHSLLEHIHKLDYLMSEIWRVLKSTGRNYIFVPHFSNPYYYSDYTHKRFFGLYSFEYFSNNQNRFFRKVPTFYQNINFTTEEIQLEFTSPWRSRRLLKKIAQKLFNFSPFWQELYEENFIYIIPCYGIRAILKPIK